MKPSVLLLLLLVLGIYCSSPSYTPNKKHISIEAYIYTNSQSPTVNLFDSIKFWQSSFPENTIIYIKFMTKKFISRIKMNFLSKNQVSLKIYSANKIINTSHLKNITIDDTTNFIILKYNLKNKNLTFVADNQHDKYYISLSKQYTPLKINSLIIEGNDTLFSIKPKIMPKFHLSKQGYISEILEKNIVYKKDNQLKTFFMDTTGNVVIYQKQNNNEKFFFGQIQSILPTMEYDKINIKGQLFNIQNKKIVIKNYSGIIKYYANILKNETFGTIKFRPLNDESLVDVGSLDTNLIIDIRYATTNNFTKRKLYPCAICLLHYNIAKDLIAANKEFMKNNYKLVIHDCYRPFSVQKQMWNVVHNKNYVAPPNIGSAHNRATAVDLTIQKINGDTVDMGTTYDYFGKKAFTNYTNLPPKVLNNRKILQKIMIKHNFKPIKTEWWHFHHISINKYPILDMPLPCKKVKN